MTSPLDASATALIGCGFWGAKTRASAKVKTQAAVAAAAQASQMPQDLLKLLQ